MLSRGAAGLFFFIASLRCVSANAPTFTIRPRSVTVTEGETVRLQCSASGTPTPVLSWTIGTSNLQPNSDGTLTIRPIRKSDEGTYVCTVSNVNGQKQTSATVTVNQRYKPYFTTAPQNITVSEGSTVKLPCMAIGTPSPIIRWTKINGHLPEGYSTKSGYLTLPHVNKSASGVFRCTSINAHGSVSASATLTVLDPIIFRKTPRDHNGNIGETALLECSIDPKGTSATIDWLKDDIPIDLSTNSRYSIIAGGSLLIADLQREDMALYICRARGAVGTTTASAVVLLPGARQPEFTSVSTSGLVPPTETIRLDCKANGVPDPQLAWTKDGKSLTDFDGRYGVVGSQLIVVSARTEDSGNFTCTASNIVGAVSKSVIVSVADPRPTTSEPISVSNITEETDKGLSLLYIIILAGGITGGAVIIITVILVYCCCLRNASQGATIEKALKSPSFASWQDGGVHLGSIPPSYFPNSTFEGLDFQTFDTANQMLLQRLHNLEVDTHSSDKFQQALAPDWVSSARYTFEEVEDDCSEEGETDESDESGTETSPDTSRRPPRGYPTHNESKNYGKGDGKSTGYRRDSNRNQAHRVSAAYSDSGSSTKCPGDRKHHREYRDKRNSKQRSSWRDNRSSNRRSPSHGDSGYDEMTAAEYRHSTQEPRTVDRRRSADDGGDQRTAKRGDPTRGSRRYSEDISYNCTVIYKASDQGPLDTIQSGEHDRDDGPRKTSSRKLIYDHFNGRDNAGRKHSPTSLSVQPWTHDQQMLY